jgi:hypothetical protein
LRRVVGPATNLSKRAAPVERSFAQSKKPEAREKKGKKSDKTEKRPKEEKATKKKKKKLARWLALVQKLPQRRAKYDIPA